MERRWLIGAGIVLLFIFMVVFSGEEVVEDDASVVVPVNVPTPTPVPVPVPTPAAINFQKHNIDYMNDNIKAILVKQLGESGRTAFYFPATGYVNVSRGTKYGVAFAIQNVNPKVPEGNFFAYDFEADASSVEKCGVSSEEAQSWIERGWSSSGMISGQWREDWNEWHDAMTIYFAFPSDVEACSMTYDFVITKDGVDYDSRSLLFNLV